MKKLVYLSAFLSPYRSGAEAMVEEVSKRLSSQYDITIITGRYSRSLPKYDTLLPPPLPLPGGGRDVSQTQIKIIRVGLGLPIDKWLFPFLAPLKLGSLKPDIVHAVLETFAGLALFFCRCHAKTILTLQTTNRSFLRRPILRHPDTVTAISTALVTVATSYGRNDVVLIPNGIDLASMKEACQFHEKVPGRILFVGRLEPMKGIDILLKAFAKAVPTLGASAHLRIVGGGSLENSLQTLASDLGITSQVTFTGRIVGKAVFDEYAKAEIFCGLSRSEALGNVFLEAQAAGCAVVATNVGGIPDIIKDSVSGILIPVDDVDQAVRALETLSKNPEMQRAYAEAGRKNAAAYDWDDISKRYAEILS